MPHISLKMYKGRSSEEKNKIAYELLKVLENNGIKSSSVSVSISDVEPEKWKEEVYDREINGNEDIIIKPGYEMWQNLSKNGVKIWL